MLESWGVVVFYEEAGTLQFDDPALRALIARQVARFG